MFPTLLQLLGTRQQRQKGRETQGEPKRSYQESFLQLRKKSQKVLTKSSTVNKKNTSPIQLQKNISKIQYYYIKLDDKERIRYDKIMISQSKHSHF